MIQCEQEQWGRWSCEEARDLGDIRSVAQHQDQPVGPPERPSQARSPRHRGTSAGSRQC